MKIDYPRRLSLIRALSTLLASGIAPARAFRIVTAEAGTDSWLATDPVTECLLASGETEPAAVPLALRRLEIETLFCLRVRRMISRASTLVLVGVLGFLTGFLVFGRAVQDTYGGVGPSHLPMATRWILELARAAEGLGPLLSLGLVIGIFYATLFTAYRWGTRLPVLRGMFRRFQGARLRRDLGTLLTAGVAPVRSLEALARRAREERDGQAAAQFSSAAAFVIHGESLSGALRRARCDASLVALVASGEDTGSAESLLINTAILTERGVAESLNTIARWLIPVVAFSLLLCTSAVVMAIFAPIFMIW